MPRTIHGILLLALLASAGCPDSATAECDNGSVCRPGFRCAGPDVGRQCILISCGDGKVDPGEVCDDGNNVSSDGCPADCSEPCGDRHVDPGEACDDGNTVSGDGCSADCLSQEVCGNGVLDPDEACDDNNLQGHDGCSNRCTLESPSWSPIDLAPAGRQQYAMVYDAARGVAVLFGGRGSNNELFSDTWEWNGATWRQRRPATVPPGRAQHTMAYDAGRHRIVMFGGTGPGDNGTWEFDGFDWVERLPTMTPPSLVNAAMVYDAGMQKVVLFGGFGRNVHNDLADMDQTWTWDGASWQEIAPAIHPSARSQHAMAYDGKHNQIVLFGGRATAEATRDTWTFDGVNWTLQSTASALRERSMHTMTFDTVRGTVVMFGGEGPPAFHLVNETWEWDGSTWTQRPAAPAPSPRGATAMTYDIARDRIVLFGGKQAVDDAGFNLPTDTWEWSNGTWIKQAVGSSAPVPRQGHAMAYNPVRRNIVLFGGSADPFDSAPLDDTWDWDGLNWEREVHILLPTAPTPRSGLAMATVENGIIRGIMMFGGNNAGPSLNDTWFLSTQWGPLRGGFPSETASVRQLTAVAYDAKHKQLVMFGGEDRNSNALSDTLVWNVPGIDWVPITPAHSPPARFAHSMAYDSKRERVVLFGGLGSFSGGAWRNDTWEWDGTDWTPMTPATSPTPRGEHAMAYDIARARLVMFGGSAGLDFFRDTWEWDGVDWHLQTPATMPPARRRPAMAYDPGRGRIVMFGGDEGHSDITSSLLNDTWEWDGVDWHWIAFSTTPPVRTGHAMAYDPRRGSTLLFGGQNQEHILSDTWIWNGVSWQQRRPAVSPPPRVQHAIAFDSARGRAVLFGGSAPLDVFEIPVDDTWEWDGSTWIPRTSDIKPPARSGHALVYDGARGKTVLFGGDIGLPPDQWEWDGTSWLRVVPPVLPPSRRGFAMAYDADRQKVVLFGGQNSAGLLGDVWEWDGTTWNERTPRSGPAPKPRTLHTLVYNAARRRTLLFGGLLFNDIWEWDGTAWTQLLPSTAPMPRGGHVMVYDAARGELVLFGGARGELLNGALNDTWLFRFEESAPLAEACRTGLDGDGDGKIGCADPDCGGLCTLCGNSVCDPLESCSLCPEDCGACNLCGDLVCDPAESCTSCPGDCATCTTTTR